MRLTTQQVQTIKSAAEDIFGAEARVWLFGSRVDDSKRGGDIDLYLELPEAPQPALAELESKFWARLQQSLGEQKIDIVSRVQGSPSRPIDEQARRTGVCL
jgi:predicted nucleotidyltransferase